MLDDTGGVQAPSKRKKLIVVTVMFVVFVVAAILIVLFRQQDQAQEIGEEPASDALVEQELNQSLEAFRQSNANLLKEGVAAISNVSDLRKLDDESQRRIGTEKTRQLISAGELTLAREFAIYLTAREDSTGLEAAVLCYQSSQTEVEQNECVLIANEKARQQGIIGENEELPDTYFESRQGVS